MGPAQASPRMTFAHDTKAEHHSPVVCYIALRNYRSGALAMRCFGMQADVCQDRATSVRRRRADLAESGRIWQDVGRLRPELAGC